MTDSTWDDYLDSGGTDSAELQDLAGDLGAEAEVLESAAVDAGAGGPDGEAIDDAAGELRDAEWNTSTAAEWTTGAEHDAAYVDKLDVEGEQHLQGAADALAQGDTAAAEWESAMADSSFQLADDSIEQSDAGLGLADESLATAAGDVGLAADSLADTSVDSTLDTGIETETDLGTDDTI